MNREDFNRLMERLMMIAKDIDLRGCVEFANTVRIAMAYAGKSGEEMIPEIDAQDSYAERIGDLERARAFLRLLKQEVQAIERVEAESGGDS